MFQIRREQIDALTQNQNLRFAKRVSDFSRDILPESCKTFNSETLMDMIKKSINNATDIGLTWQNNIAAICLIDLKFKVSVLDDPELRKSILDSTNPDMFFRHRFSEPSSDIWKRFNTDETGR